MAVNTIGWTLKSIVTSIFRLIPPLSSTVSTSYYPRLLFIPWLAFCYVASVYISPIQFYYSVTSSFCMGRLWESKKARHVRPRELPSLPLLALGCFTVDKIGPTWPPTWSPTWPELGTQVGVKSGSGARLEPQLGAQLGSQFLAIILFTLVDITLWQWNF